MNPELPDWAIGTTDGQLVLGAQLPTRDGRHCGNAHIIEITEYEFPAPRYLYTVLTDAGSEITKLTESEVNQLFHPPKWVSDVNEVKRKFQRHQE